jgi:RNA ligase (TIGR02306 family)
MSTHVVEIVPVTLQEHPDADTLSVVEVYGYTCCVRTADFQGVAAGAYIPPDSLVDPERPEFAFMKPKADPAKHDGKVRIRVSKMRGVISQGLLLPAKDGWEIGQDVMAELGVEHYEPPLPMQVGGQFTTPPPGDRKKYDVEDWRRYGHLLEDGEEVVATEKIHGTNSRYCFAEGQMYAGTRANWMQYNPVTNVYWRALEQCPALREFCEQNPELTVYGEVFGPVQKLKYGAKNNDCFFRAFDILYGNQWLDHDEAREKGKDLPWVPELYRGPYDAKKLEELAEGKTTLNGADHIREGIVIKPVKERRDMTAGRVQFKIVSNAYLGSKKL